MTNLSYIVNKIAAGDMVMQGAVASTVLVLAMFSLKIPASVREYIVKPWVVTLINNDNKNNNLSFLKQVVLLLSCGLKLLQTASIVSSYACQPYWINTVTDRLLGRVAYVYVELNLAFASLKTSRHKHPLYQYTQSNGAAL